jgi:hypothetical protein
MPRPPPPMSPNLRPHPPPPAPPPPPPPPSNFTMMMTSAPVTVHQSLPRRPKPDPLEAIGDTLATMGRRAPQSILVSKPPNSGRMSAEPSPFDTRRGSTSSSEFRLSAALNALDLEHLDLRNIDPVMASKLLQEIRNGADVAPLLEKLTAADAQQKSEAAAAAALLNNGSKKEHKMVTFEDETKPGMEDSPTRLNADDVFM